MKKIILSILILSVSTFCIAQTDDKELTDSVTINNYAPKQIYYLKNKKTMLTHNFRIGFLFGKDDIMSPNLSGYSDEFESDVNEKTEQGTSYGLNLAYRIIFTPGMMDKKNHSFQTNPLGFGYSFGIEISGDLQKNYGFTCDILAAAGIELGTQKIGFGLDGLVGTGNSTGFMLLSHLTDPELSYTYNESFMAFKYGAQIWIKVPSLFGGLFGAQPIDNGKDIRISLRYIRSTLPQRPVSEGYYAFPIFSEEGLCAVISFTF